MEGVVERTTVKLGPHYIHEGERRGQSSETATSTIFFYYKRPNFSDWIKADRFVVLMTSLSDVEQMCLCFTGMFVL